MELISAARLAEKAAETAHSDPPESLKLLAEAFAVFVRTLEARMKNIERDLRQMKQ